MPELIETKQRERKASSISSPDGVGSLLFAHKKFTQLELTTALTTRTFEGFNDLCTKTHYMELQSNKRKKPSKERALRLNNMAVTVHPKATPALPSEEDLLRNLDSRMKVAIIHPRKSRSNRAAPTAFS